MEPGSTNATIILRTHYRYSPENLRSGRRVMRKLIKVALNLKLTLFYDMKKSGNFKF